MGLLSNTKLGKSKIVQNISKVLKKVAPDTSKGMRSEINLGGASTIGKKIVSSVGQKIIDKPLKSAVIGLVGAGYVRNQGIKQTGKDVVNLGSGFENVGYNLGELKNNPSKANVEKLFRENPFIVGTAVLGAGAVATRTAYGVSSLYNITKDTPPPLIPQDIPKDVNSKVIDIVSNIPKNSDTQSDIIGGKQSDLTLTNDKLTPFETATTSKTASAVKRRKKSKIKAKPQNINIRVINNNQDEYFKPKCRRVY
jgi:hypothetical protein